VGRGNREIHENTLSILEAYNFDKVCWFSLLKYVSQFKLITTTIYYIQEEFESFYLDQKTLWRKGFFCQRSTIVMEQ
jgi:hypothetical protein